MDQSRGYVCLYRKITESLHGDGYAQAVMCQLLARVTHQPYKYLKYDLGPGQVMLSCEQLSQFTGFARSTVWNALIRLEKRGTISRALAGRDGTVITLVNWGTYQGRIEEGKTVGGRKRFLAPPETVLINKNKQEERNDLSNSSSSTKKESAQFDPIAWERGDYDPPEMVDRKTPANS